MLCRGNLNRRLFSTFTRRFVMRSNNLVILVVALVLGGIAAVLARNWLTSHVRSTQVGVGTIVVAAGPLTFATQLTRTYLKIV